MNSTVLQLKQMQRAMRSYVLTLYEIVLESEPEYVLEIGTGQCQSTRTMLSAMKEIGKGHLVSIDTRDRAKRVPEELKGYLTHIIGDSHAEATIERVRGCVKQPFDLLFIDGDHTYEGVKNDFLMYSPLVKENGLIIMHDICNKNEGVKEFWKEIGHPKIALNYGKAARGVVPGLGIIQKVNPYAK